MTSQAEQFAPRRRRTISTRAFCSRRAAGLTNSPGGINSIYKYDPYGTITFETSGGQFNPIRYAGYYWNSTTSLYKTDARYYDPVMGRFTQRDPVNQPLDTHGWNQYTYASDNPIDNVDPSGEWTCNLRSLHGWSTLVKYGTLGCTKSGARAENRYIYPVLNEINTFGGIFGRIPFVRNCLFGGGIGVLARISFKAAPEFTLPFAGFGCLGYNIIK